MPETAVDVDDLPQPRKDEIGRAGEGSGVQAVAIAERMREAADNHFGGRVFRLHGRHNARSFAFGYTSVVSSKFFWNVH